MFSHQACLPADGVCTHFPFCTKESIKFYENGLTIAGHGDYLCPLYYDICCFPDPVAIEEHRQFYEEQKEKKRIAAEEQAARDKKLADNN